MIYNLSAKLTMKAPIQDKLSGTIPDTANSDIRLITISEDLNNTIIVWQQLLFQVLP